MLLWFFYQKLFTLDTTSDFVSYCLLDGHDTSTWKCAWLKWCLLCKVFLYVRQRSVILWPFDTRRRNYGFTLIHSTGVVTHTHARIHINVTKQYKFVTLGGCDDLWFKRHNKNFRPQRVGDPRTEKQKKERLNLLSTRGWTGKHSFHGCSFPARTNSYLRKFFASK